MPVLHARDTTLSYSIEGEGPNALFVQGVGLTGKAWSPQISELSAAYRCIALDNRGIGESVGDTRKLSVEVMARDALAVLDALAIARAHLVGHSLGGVIVQCMALLAPERVASLSFLCTFAGGRDLRKPSARLLWLGARSRIGTRSMRQKAFARLIMPDLYLQSRGLDSVMTELEAVFGRPLWQAPSIADAQLSALRAYDRREQLPKLAALHNLVLSGRHDPIASHAANTVLAKATGARHRSWEDASHALPIQHARAVNAELRAHFAEADAARAR